MGNVMKMGVLISVEAFLKNSFEIYYMKDSALGGALGFSYKCLHLANVLLLDFCPVCCVFQFLLARKGVIYTHTNLYGGVFLEVYKQDGGEARPAPSR